MAGKWNVILFSLALVLGVSCTKDANVKLPDVPSKLVIVCFISPQDSIIKMTLTLSEPLYNNANKNKYRPVTSALVVISSELGSGTLTYNPLTEYYEIDSTQLKVREGYTYSIQVSTPDGKSVNATTSIPSLTKITSMTRSGDSTSLDIAWSDNTSTVDNYRIFVQQSNFFLFEGYNQSGPFSDTIISRYAQDAWIPDTEGSGGAMHKKVDYYGRFLNMDYYVYLLHVSKEYYDYGMKMQFAWQGDNPFSEPVPMYSNVNGGFGIFAGFSSDKLKIP